MFKSQIKVGSTYIGGKQKTRRKVKKIDKNLVEYEDNPSAPLKISTLATFAAWAEEEVD